MMSAPMPLALAMKSREAVFRQVVPVPHPYHWRPWVLIPRSWIALPQELTNWFPETRGFPLMDTGEASTKVVGVEKRMNKTKLENDFRRVLKKTFFQKEEPLLGRVKESWF